MLLTTLDSKYPNLVYLFELLLVFPVSNAKVERGFSTMRRIKSDWRNRLSEDAFGHLMRMKSTKVQNPRRSLCVAHKQIYACVGGSIYSACANNDRARAIYIL